MGWNDHLDDSEISNLPPEAYGSNFQSSSPFDPDDHWLKTAEPDQQLIAMRAWFCARFCDPAHETPYNGREGGYLFVNGGPADPADELPDRFEGVVDDDLIQQVVDEMHIEVGEQWAPIRLDRPEDYDDYDDRFGLDVGGRAEPLMKLRERLRQSRSLLALRGDALAEQLAEKLVFGAAIGALESFLWETAHYWIENDEAALRDFVTKLPVFSQEPIKLGDLFERQAGLKAHVMGHLQNMVWHRWDKVVPIFRIGLGITLPSMKPFEPALIKRHDIVHRSGHDKDGTPINVTPTEIEELCVRVETFAEAVDALLAPRGAPGTLPGSDAPDF